MQTRLKRDHDTLGAAGNTAVPLFSATINYPSTTPRHWSATKGSHRLHGILKSTQTTWPRICEVSTDPLQHGSPTSERSWVEGLWSVRRSVRNCDLSYLFEGTATICSSPSSPGLTYWECVTDRERVTLASTRTLWLAPLSATRYDLMRTDKGHISTWDLSHTTTVVYDCAPDLYVITSHCQSRELIEEEWRVTGPCKNYIAHHRLVKRE